MLMERRELVRYVGGKLTRFGDWMQKKIKKRLTRKDAQNAGLVCCVHELK